MGEAFKMKILTNLLTQKENFFCKFDLKLDILEEELKSLYIKKSISDSGIKLFPVKKFLKND